LSEPDNPTFIDRLARGFIKQALGSVRKFVERYVKRIIRLVAMVLAGTAIAVMGIGFTAFGMVKWLSNLMPAWLAWSIVGSFLFVVGIALTLAALVTSRN
jgi:mannose/fructose/N-acetylgalactosamine-specific phosphotransferase system component IIC